MVQDGSGERVQEDSGGAAGGFALYKRVALQEKRVLGAIFKALLRPPASRALRKGSGERVHEGSGGAAGCQGVRVQELLFQSSGGSLRTRGERFALYKRVALQESRFTREASPWSHFQAPCQGVRVQE